MLRVLSAHRKVEMSSKLTCLRCLLCACLSVCVCLCLCLCVCLRSKSKRGDGGELELAALQACAATLCCGVVYDPSGLNEKGYIYTWLYRLLTTRDELVIVHYTVSQKRIPDTQELIFGTNIFFIFRFFCFLQAVLMLTLGEVGSWMVIWRRVM